MDATKLLEADHRQVEALLDQVKQSKGQDRVALIDELATSLRAHMELEERALYPAMEPVTGTESVQEAQTEHELIRKTLAEVMSLSPEEPGFGAALDAVKAGIEHHVEDEESEVFPELRKDGNALAEMATPFMHTRSELGLPMSADALEAASTKEELLAEAKAVRRK